MLLRVKNEGGHGLRGGGHDLICSPSIIFTEGVLESDSEAEEGLSPLHPLYIKVWADQISISLVGNKLSYGIWSLMWTKNYSSWVIYYKYVIFQK